jgi:hypothetical protein
MEVEMTAPRTALRSSWLVLLALLAGYHVPEVPDHDRLDAAGQVTETLDLSAQASGGHFRLSFDGQAVWYLEYANHRLCRLALGP